MKSAFELAEALIKNPVKRYDSITYALIQSSISWNLETAKLWFSAAEILKDWTENPKQVPDARESRLVQSTES